MPFLFSYHHQLQYPINFTSRIYSVLFIVHLVYFPHALPSCFLVFAQAIHLDHTGLTLNRNHSQE